MKKIIITTESCSDLTNELKQQFNIFTIPMHIVFPTESFDDGSIPVQYVYDYYNKTKNVPKTSAVNPSEFSFFFEKLSRDNDNADIVHIGYSSECSSTFQNAIIGVRDCVGVTVHLVDSKNVSGGAAIITLIAAKLLSENPEITSEELAEKTREFVPKIATCFVPDRLEYLVAGGRVSNAMAIGASILKLKPRVDIFAGKLVATKKYRGSMARIVDKLVVDFVEKQDLLRDLMFLIYVPGADEKIVENVAVKLKDYGFKNVIVLTTSCVMSTHGGPGAIGFSAIKNS